MYSKALVSIIKKALQTDESQHLQVTYQAACKVGFSEAEREYLLGNMALIAMMFAPEKDSSTWYCHWLSGTGQDSTLSSMAQWVGAMDIAKLKLAELKAPEGWQCAVVWIRSESSEVSSAVDEHGSCCVVQ